MSQGAMLLPAHVDIDDLQATLDSEIATLSPRPSDSAVAFLSSAMFWVIEWAMHHGSDALASVEPFAIVDADAHLLDDSSDWTRQTFFKEAKPLDVGGLLIATGTSMFDVWARPSGASGLLDLGAKIMSGGLSAKPMLVVEPSSGRMFYCPDGASSRRLTLRIPLSIVTHLTQAAVDEALEDFHLQYTAYPDGLIDPWHDRPSRVLLRHAENVVRNALFVFFRNITFQSQYVTREEMLSSGFADISIHDKGPGKVAMCVFELKALRSRGLTKQVGKAPRAYSTKSVERHVRRGIRQAEKYKAASKAGLAYVCLYDGRDKDDPLSELETLADQRGVTWRRYYMHASTRDDLDE